MQPDVMFPNDPVESREQMLRDNCDQIEQRSFTRSFSQDEVYARRAELEQVSIQVAELEDELAQIRADIKGRRRMGNGRHFQIRRCGGWHSRLLLWRWLQD